VVISAAMVTAAILIAVWVFRPIRPAGALPTTKVECEAAGYTWAPSVANAYGSYGDCLP
jgi:hypothetical protein